MPTNNKITEIFRITDEFCRKFNETVKNLSQLLTNGKHPQSFTLLTSLGGQQCITRINQEK